MNTNGGLRNRWITSMYYQWLLVPYLSHTRPTVNPQFTSKLLFMKIMTNISRKLVNFIYDIFLGIYCKSLSCLALWFHPYRLPLFGRFLYFEKILNLHEMFLNNIWKLGQQHNIINKLINKSLHIVLFTIEFT